MRKSAFFHKGEKRGSLFKLYIPRKCPFNDVLYTSGRQRGVVLLVENYSLIELLKFISESVSSILKSPTLIILVWFLGSRFSIH